MTNDYKHLGGLTRSGFALTVFEKATPKDTHLTYEIRCLKTDELSSGRIDDGYVAVSNDALNIILADKAVGRVPSYSRSMVEAVWNHIA